MATALCSAPRAGQPIRIAPTRASPRSTASHAQWRAAGPRAGRRPQGRLSGAGHGALGPAQGARRSSVAVCSAVPSSAYPAGAAETGDVVSVRLVLSLAETGEVLHSSPEEEPLTFEVGSGNFMASPLFKDLDGAVRGLQVGQKNKFQSRPMERSDDFVFEVPRGHEEMQRIEAEEGAKGRSLEPGLVVQLSNGNPAVIVQLSPELIVLDANHPLAGRDVTFEVELLQLDKQQ